MAAGVTAETFLARGSSYIDQFTYDPESMKLVVAFQDGSVWTYEGVDPEVVGHWQRDGGSGRFFRARIRDAYPSSEGEDL